MTIEGVRPKGRGRRVLAARCLAAVCVSAIVLAPCAQVARAQVPTSVRLEDLTWTELRDRVASGTTTVLVPIGGTEQSGPYVALGKHNARASELAVRIAQRLGNAVVAPVVAYVPEGSIDPPAAHMRFSGTISISDATFEALLESTARSLRRHGMRDIVFLGDHGGYQHDLEHVAARLNREWGASSQCRVHALTQYYQVTQTDYVQALRAQGYSAQEIGTHAGLADTALTLALAPAMVREQQLARSPPPGVRDGVYGDPRRATAALGQLGVERIVEQSVSAIREYARAH
jgi:creatinine amidohydrolase/Fe(II)-dependent formamide hydrolase-like protein